jgi:hypothetical protein
MRAIVSPQKEGRSELLWAGLASPQHPRFIEKIRAIR